MSSDYVIPIDFYGFYCITDINTIIEPLVKLLSLNYFGQTRLYREGTLTGLYSNIEIPNTWLKNKYCIPGAQETGTALEPGFYYANEIAELHTPGCLETLSESYDANHILYFVERQPDYDDHYMFSCDLDNKNAISNYINNMPFIEKFIQYYKELSSELLDRAAKTRVILPTFKFDPSDYHNLCSSIKNHEGLLENFFPPVVEIRFDDNKSVKLTKIQFFYFCLLASGHSAKMIANKFNVSVRTVEDHICKLKQKFQKHRKSDLIELFWKNAKNQEVFFEYLKIVLSLF